MQRRRTLWSLACVFCVGLAVCLWLASHRGPVSGAGQQSSSSPGSKVAGSSPTQAQAKAPKSPFLALSQHNAPTKGGAASSSIITNRLAYRLSNTTESLTQLMRNDRGILLANALIDTGEPLNLGIPSWLRAPAQNNGSFVVQAKGPVDDAFRASLRAAGATIVSYIPNNAFLVTASDAGANQLKSDPATQAVLPYEPYYKLDASLLKLAVEGDPMPVATDLRVTLFPDPASSAGAYAAFKQMGIGVGQPERSPFGPVVAITPTSDQLAAVAQLPGVQLIEPVHARKLANDLFRVRLGISPDPVTTNTNYLNLTGSNILITLADSGVNGNHPDLTGRVFGANASDTAGHGTHVAGTIAGNGTASYPPFLLSTPIGSTTNENLRGMAPLASLYSLVLPGYEAGSFGSDLGKAKEFSDGTLQAAAAQSNSLISNNSWNYDSASEYDIAAASYDAAVRDALPQVKGPQPVLFVFSAGNAGNGDDNGLSGDPESILSPATAKNVITVGAIEQPRNITNSITLPDFNTVQPFLAQTDSSNQVAGFSSRGNVGIGIEGDAGRFKPDVIAPGTMVVSDASQDWDTNAYYSPTNFSFNAHTNQAVQPNTLQPFSIFIPDNAVGLTISVATNFNSPNPMPPMPIYLKEDDNPTVNTFDLLGTNSVSLPPSTLPGGDIIALRGHTIFYSVGDPTNQVVAFDAETVLVTTNLNPAVILLETNLNFQLGTPPPLYYRYESGTSMSAAGISGMLALIQQFFQQQLGVGISPALMKALLINGARSLGTPYDFQVASLINYQGWGLPAIGNSLPLALTNLTSTNDTADLAKMPLQFIDQSPTNALATGQSRTWSLNLSPAAQTVPLRVTLVWTDPPGNPTAGVKLVNNLALVVTNVVGTNVSIFFGNDIPAGATFNEAWDPGTNNPPSWDMVNNVQNVFLAPPLGSNCTITVYGLRVNVNAVTANTNAVVQDFALVMSSDVGGATFTNSLTLTNSDVVTSNILTATGTLTNGVPLLNQRVGGNSQYAPGTNGVTNQWNFYVYTNTAFLTNSFFTNVAFVTFAPPELGVPREGVNQEANPPNATRPEADIDMYVSFDPTLTNLNPAAIAGANKSVGRTGTEKVLFTNQQTAGPYYIGVRSQDQQGAQFNLVGVATDQPFNQNQGTGPYPLTILGSFPVNIPDGSPSLPGAVTIIGLTSDSSSVRRIIVTNGITHPSFSDLIGALSHGQKSAVLNNHKQFVNPSDGSETLIYDDSGEGDVLGKTYGVGALGTAWPAPIYAKTSDGPGSLTTFEGDLAGDGVWQLTMVDDSLGFTGSISNLAIVVDPNPPTNHFTVGIGANSSFDFFINVPPNATNLTINISFNGVSQGLDMYVKRGSPASATSFDFFQVIPPGGGQMVINEFTAPPLNPGIYYVHLFNPSTLPVSVNVDYQIILDTSPPPIPGFLSAGNEPILDDAVTYSTNHLSNNKTVLSLEVGVRIDHPRVSDLALTLISPKGTRCLLAENRGGLTTNGYGSGYNVTNGPVTAEAGGPGGATNIIPTGANQGTLIISYDFFQIPDTMHVYYDGVRILDSGLVSGAGTFQVDFGPGLSSNVVVIMDENSTESLGDAWQYSLTVIEQKITYAVFTENTNETTLPIKFAPPPFGTVATPAPVTNFISSFETNAPGDYAFPATVDGWTVLDANPVKVVTVPVFAPNGSNVLALHSGTITRTLPTIPGQKFTLSLLTHGRPVLNTNVVSWWKGDGNAYDSADGNAGTPMNGAGYSAGLVSNAFNFNSASQQYIHLTNAPNLTPPGSFAIESWINFTNSAAQEIILGKWGDTHQSYALSVMPGDSLQFAINDAAHQGVPGFQIFNTSANVVAPNVWQHVAATYDTNTGTMAVYVNGQLVGAYTAPPITIFQGPSPVGIGAIDALVDPKTSFFDGAIDELAFYTNALIPYQLQDIYAAGSAGKCPESGSCLASLNVILGGNTNVINGLDAWQTNEFTFTATSNNMVLEFQPLDNGMLLDDIQLVQIPSSSLANFYLPEESLDKFAGENAEGDWKLEILDNRAGPPPAATNAPNLVSWKMNVVFENTQPGVEPLTHAIPVTNCVPPSQVAYFSVAVPVWASYATNTLTALSGQGAQWLLNTNVLPLSGGNDFTLGPPPVNSPGVYTNLLQSAPPVSNPPLYPGQTYYLAVANTNSTPFCFTLEVDFNIITLTNMVPFTNSIAAGNVPQYYQYDVSVPGSVVAAFQLLTNSGNLFMTVSKGPPLPDTNSFAYGSQGFGPQSIVVTSNSLPVPLAPGRWYIGVFNEGATAVSNYEIMASETVTTIIPLTNSIPYTNSAVPGVDLTPFYSFNITNANTTAALFELYRLAGNADLTLDQGVLPYTPPFFASSTRLGTNFEQIVIRSNLLGTNITGIWYLGVPNNELTNVAYTIRAVVATNGLLISDVPITVGVTLNDSGGTNTVSLTWTSVEGETYDVLTNANLATTNWGILATITNAPAYNATFTDPTPINGIPYMFYWIEQVPTP